MTLRSKVEERYRTRSHWETIRGVVNDPLKLSRMNERSVSASSSNAREIDRQTQRT